MNPKNGQAMAEFVVALVVIMVLLACIFQVSMISARQSQLFIAAREEAAVAAMQEASILSDPDYIHSWTEGPDESSYSADDEMTEGLVSDIPLRITSHSSPDALLSVLPENRISQLHGSPLPHTLFGSVQGIESDSVELLPVIRSLLYNEEEITLEAEVWLPQTGGIY